MKSLAIILAALVGTLILNGPIQSYADPQLDTLVNIATQARDNLKISMSQISNVPNEITQLYKQGSDETNALTKAVNDQDVVSARQHFLSAMKFFKTTNDKINSLNATEANDQQRADIMRLQSEITRLEKIGETLRTIAITNHADFEFTQFDTSIQKATQDLDAGKIEEASKSIKTANQLIIDAHHSLAAIAKQRTSDRAKDFTEKQIERFNKMGDLNATQNPMVQAPKIAMSKTSSNLTSEENPREMIAKLRKLVSEGNVDEALKVIKSLKAYQKEKLKTNESSVQSQSQTSVNIQNNTEPSSNSTTITLPSNVTVANSTTITSPSNVTVANHVKTDSSSNANPSQTDNGEKTSKTKPPVIPQGSVDSGQQDKTHDEKNHEKRQLEKLKNEKQNHRNNSQSKDNQG